MRVSRLVTSGLAQRVLLSADLFARSSGFPVEVFDTPGPRPRAGTSMTKPKIKTTLIRLAADSSAGEAG